MSIDGDGGSFMGPQQTHCRPTDVGNVNSATLPLMAYAIEQARISDTAPHERIASAASE